jgi:hypothetical protein
MPVSHIVRVIFLASSFRESPWRDSAICSVLQVDVLLVVFQVYLVNPCIDYHCHEKKLEWPTHNFFELCEIMRFWIPDETPRGGSWSWPRSIRKMVLQVAINLADGEGLWVELVNSQILVEYQYLIPIRNLGPVECEGSRKVLVNQKRIPMNGFDMSKALFRSPPLTILRMSMR